MEYFIDVNGEKQGPFDLVALIKKIKNSSLTGSSLLATNVNGPFVNASEIAEVAALINEHTKPIEEIADSGPLKVTLKAAIVEGIDLWSRRVLDYTIIAGLMMGVGFGVQFLLKSIFPEGNILPTYFASVIVLSLFFVMCFYVLETKRSQELGAREFAQVIKRTLPSFMGVAALLCLSVLFYAVNVAFGVLASFFMIVALTFLVFMPFLVTDGNIPVVKAAKLSANKVQKIGTENFGVLLAIVSINLFAAILPAFIMPNLMALGLFISVPVTISAIAYIYDQVFV